MSTDFPEQETKPINLSEAMAAPHPEPTATPDRKALRDLLKEEVRAEARLEQLRAKYPAFPPMLLDCERAIAFGDGIEKALWESGLGRHMPFIDPSKELELQWQGARVPQLASWVRRWLGAVEAIGRYEKRIRARFDGQRVLEQIRQGLALREPPQEMGDLIRAEKQRDAIHAKIEEAGHAELADQALAAFRDSGVSVGKFLGKEPLGEAGPRGQGVRYHKPPTDRPYSEVIKEHRLHESIPVGNF